MDDNVGTKNRPRPFRMRSWIRLIPRDHSLTPVWLTETRIGKAVASSGPFGHNGLTLIDAGVTSVQYLVDFLVWPCHSRTTQKSLYYHL